MPPHREIETAHPPTQQFSHPAASSNPQRPSPAASPPWKQHMNDNKPGQHRNDEQHMNDNKRGKHMNDKTAYERQRTTKGRGGGGRGGEGISFSKEMKRNSFSLFFARPSSDRGSRQPSTTTTSARRHSLRPREQPPAFNYYYIRRHFIYYLYAPTTVTATPQSPTMTTNGRERSRRARAPHLQHRGRSALRWDCFVRVTPTAA